MESRRLLTVAALLIAMLGVVAAPALAGLAHPVCATRQHECGMTPTITQCCCHDETSGTNQSEPAPSRAQLNVNPATAPCVVGLPPVTTPFRTSFRVESVPRAGPVDFQTLFACLLI